MKIIGQLIKHLIVGAFATLVDLAIFEFLILFFVPLVQIKLIIKSTSFLFATAIKYWGNKHWVFQKPEKDGMLKEVFQFALITVAGLAIDVVSFYYFSFYFWQPVSVIFAAAIAAVWNFTAYKFLVFKK